MISRVASLARPRSDRGARHDRPIGTAGDDEAGLPSQQGQELARLEARAGRLNQPGRELRSGPRLAGQLRGGSVWRACHWRPDGRIGRHVLGHVARRARVGVRGVHHAQEDAAGLATLYRQADLLADLERDPADGRDSLSTDGKLDPVAVDVDHPGAHGLARRQLRALWHDQASGARRGAGYPFHRATTPGGVGRIGTPLVRSSADGFPTVASRKPIRWG